MNNSVITVIGKDRVGIVYDVSKILAENRINILNISQQLMDDFFTMIILVDTSKCPKSRQEVLDLFAEERQKTRARHPYDKTKKSSKRCTAFELEECDEYPIRRNFRNRQNGCRPEF